MGTCPDLEFEKKLPRNQRHSLIASTDPVLRSSLKAEKISLCFWKLMVR